MSAVDDAKQGAWAKAWADHAAEQEETRKRCAALGIDCQTVETCIASLQQHDFSCTIAIQTSAPDDFVADISWREISDSGVGARLLFRVEGYGTTMMDALLDAVAEFLFHRDRLSGEAP